MDSRKATKKYTTTPGMSSLRRQVPFQEKEIELRIPPNPAADAQMLENPGLENQVQVATQCPRPSTGDHPVAVDVTISPISNLPLSLSFPLSLSVPLSFSLFLSLSLSFSLSLSLPPLPLSPSENCQHLGVECSATVQQITLFCRC